VRKPVTRLLLLAGLGLTVACSERAGVRGREDTGASSSDATPERIEEVRIDGVLEDLVPIRSLAVAPDGTIAVTQDQDGAVRFFTSSGEALGSFGRNGEGPGEFRGLNRLGWLADTLWVLDAMQARITLISPERELVRTIRTPTRAGPAPADSGRIPEFPIAIPIGIRGDGALHVMLMPGVGQPVPEPYRDATAWGIVSLSGIIGRIVSVRRPPSDAAVRLSSARGVSVASVPFTSRTHYGVSADGSRSVLAESPVEGPAAGSIDVSVFGPAGDTLLFRRYPFEGVPIPAAVADSVMSARERQLGANSPELAAAFRKGARLPRIHPPVASLIVGRDGTVWMERPGDAGRRVYFVVDSLGEPVGTIDLPRNATVSAAERGRIWVLERDENDVQSIVRYGIRWRAG